MVGGTGIEPVAPGSEPVVTHPADSAISTQQKTLLILADLPIVGSILLPVLPRCFEPLRQRRGALRPLLDWCS
jgi:hypothetical protein